MKEYIIKKVQTIYLLASFIMFLTTVVIPFNDETKDIICMFLFTLVFVVFLINKFSDKKRKSERA